MVGQFEHLLVSILDLLGLIIGYNHCVVLIFPLNGAVVDLKAHSPQIRYVYSLVILLVCCLEHDLLLLLIDFNDVCFLGVGEVADTPLKSINCVLSHEDGVV